MAGLGYPAPIWTRLPNLPPRIEGREGMVSSEHEQIHAHPNLDVAIKNYSSGQMPHFCGAGKTYRDVRAEVFSDLNESITRPTLRNSDNSNSERGEDIPPSTHQNSHKSFAYPGMYSHTNEGKCSWPFQKQPRTSRMKDHMKNGLLRINTFRKIQSGGT